MTSQLSNIELDRPLTATESMFGRPLTANEALLEQTLLELWRAVTPAITRALDDTFAARPELKVLLRHVDAAANDGSGTIQGLLKGEPWAIWHRFDAERRDLVTEEKGLLLEASFIFSSFWLH